MVLQARMAQQIAIGTPGNTYCYLIVTMQLNEENLFMCISRKADMPPAGSFLQSCPVHHRIRPASKGHYSTPNFAAYWLAEVDHFPPTRLAIRPNLECARDF